MANQEQLDRLLKSIEMWNRWRKDQQVIEIDLRKANLRGANLAQANLSNVNLRGANLTHANLTQTNFTQANLTRANLFRACLTVAHLRGTLLRGANIRGACLSGADLRGAILINTFFSKTDFEKAKLGWTTFSDVNLSGAQNLQSCVHHGPSYISLGTFERSGRISELFLRKAGVKGSWIDNIPSIVGRPIQFYDCFISYSHNNSEFSEKLHNDLMGRGIITWLDTHDLKVGDHPREKIEEAIRRKDKILLILSRESINSDWVEKEVYSALRKEKSQRKKNVLLPFRIDEYVMRCRKPWLLDLKETKHFGDFRNWKHHDIYTNELNKLVDQLRR